MRPAPRRGGVAALVVAFMVILGLNALPLGLGGVREYRGGVGTTVTTPTFGVHVAQVDAADALVTSNGAIRAEHAFVVARVRYDVLAENVSVEAFFVTAQGERYRPRGATVMIPGAEAGYATHGVLVFHVPRERLEGASLVFEPLAFFTSYSARVVVEDVLPAPVTPAPVVVVDDAERRLTVVP